MQLHSKDTDIETRFNAYISALEHDQFLSSGADSLLIMIQLNAGSSRGISAYIYYDIVRIYQNTSW